MTEDIGAFVDWWLGASDDERRQFIEESIQLPAPIARPPIRDVIRDLDDYGSPS